MSGKPLDYAQSYAAGGFAVIPLHAFDHGTCTCRKDCGSPAKHPRTDHGLSDATTDVQAIRDWWSKWPAANVGVVVPDGYVALDVDVEDVGGALDGRELPVTATAKTARGWHFLYRRELGAGTRAAVARHLQEGVTDTGVLAQLLHISRRTVQRHVAALGPVGQTVSPLVATVVAPILEREATPSTPVVADNVAERSADVATMSPPPIGGRSGDMSPTAGRDAQQAAGFAKYVAEAGTAAAWARVAAKPDA